jgi:hypothetical protein
MASVALVCCLLFQLGRSSSHPFIPAEAPEFYGPSFEQVVQNSKSLQDVRDHIHFLISTRLFDAVVEAGPEYIHFYSANFYDEGIVRLNWPPGLPEDLDECSLPDLQKLWSALHCNKHQLSFRILTSHTLPSKLQVKAKNSHLKVMRKEKIDVKALTALGQCSIVTTESVIAEDEGRLLSNTGHQEVIPENSQDVNAPSALNKFRAISRSRLLTLLPKHGKQFMCELSYRLDVIDARIRLNMPLQEDETFDFLFFLDE